MIGSYIMRQLALWEDDTYYKIGYVCDPQESGKPLVLIPKAVKNGKIYAKLIKRLLFKWQQEYEKK